MYLTGIPLLFCALQLFDFGQAQQIVVDRRGVDKFLSPFLRAMCERNECVVVDLSCRMDQAVLGKTRASEEAG